MRKFMLMLALILATSACVKNQKLVKLQTQPRESAFDIPKMSNQDFVDDVEIWIAQNIQSKLDSMQVKNKRRGLVIFNVTETTGGAAFGSCLFKMTFNVQKKDRKGIIKVLSVVNKGCIGGRVVIYDSEVEQVESIMESIIAGLKTFIGQES